MQMNNPAAQAMEDQIKLAPQFVAAPVYTHEPHPTYASLKAMAEELAGYAAPHLKRYPVHEAAEHLNRLANKAKELLK